MPAPLERHAAPAGLRFAARLRLRAAILAGDAAALGSRLAGKGSGASIRGQVMTRIDPLAFRKLVKGRRIAAVSGTNGKTTSTHLLAAAVRAGVRDADRVVTNADGANLHYGIASALAKAPAADLAVLETDERVVKDLITHGAPEVLVFLNFSRDQLDRHHEIKALAQAWREALGDAGTSGPVIVANADDPLVVWASGTAHEVVWVAAETLWSADSALCPACGTVLTRTGGAGADASHWDCPGCDLTEPEAPWRVVGGRIVDPAGTAWDPELRVPGRFNVNNAACALAAAAVWGVPVETALRGMRTVEAPAGRFATATFGTTTARLILAKNPAGWAEALPLLETDPVVLAIDSVAADGKDVSWLWDVEYEQLAGRRVIATGPRAHDLAVRLTYAGVEHTVVPEPGEALAGHTAPVDVIATYTPFQKLLKMAGLR
ncbi:Mur ligase family protein [Propionicicella superfundia]|uniref:Mur ligase family protein n=1 Tax=Propionicicella superfundia TaxID=348582 RepID=UPI00041B60F8|nr:Mur ligase family protein [Propionicicella superfundia]